MTSEELRIKEEFEKRKHSIQAKYAAEMAAAGSDLTKLMELQKRMKDEIGPEPECVAAEKRREAEAAQAVIDEESSRLSPEQQAEIAAYKKRNAEVTYGKI